MLDPSVVIVSPALAQANNGNWRTAQRWQRMLQGKARARVVQQWPDEQCGEDSIMLALHALRSAPSIAAWAQAHPHRGLAVVLTGTDLYRDIAQDDRARHSLALAQRLVVLQERAHESVPAAWRDKVRLIFQSTAGRPAVPKPQDHLRAVMVGHLRAVKTPQTLFEAARLLPGDAGIVIEHIGDDASDAELGAMARRTQRECPHYRWWGSLAHEACEQHIQRAHVLIHTSRMEGGAHVIMEAVRSGTPVLASHVPGNVGMLGDDYEGYFPHSDARALADLLLRCRAAQAGREPAGGVLARLHAQCAARAHLFDPSTERTCLIELLHELQG